MNHWLPPVSFPARAIPTVPTSYGRALYSHGMEREAVEVARAREAREILDRAGRVRRVESDPDRPPIGFQRRGGRGRGGYRLDPEHRRRSRGGRTRGQSQCRGGRFADAALGVVQDASERLERGGRLERDESRDRRST